MGEGLPMSREIVSAALPPLKHGEAGWLRVLAKEVTMGNSNRANRCRALAASGAVLLSAAIVADAHGDEAPPNVVREIREIQKELGGSVVQGYSELWGAKAEPRDGAKPPLGRELGVERQAAGAVWASDNDGRPREATLRVEALREAAAKLDEMANLLEPLELYSQADALREQAQRLRLDARERTAARSTPTQAVAPMTVAPAKLQPPAGYMPIPRSEERPAPDEFNAPPLFAPSERRGPMPENQLPGLHEKVEPPQLEPAPGDRQKPLDELQPTPGAPQVGDDELTPMPLSE
jgi:hypothetical protein